jgi:VWFA-related protein
MSGGQSPRSTPSPVDNSQGIGRSSSGQLQVPARPSSPLFKGTQGKQKTEIHFDPATQMVTIKLLLQDPNGYFIPNVRRENFAVYENGVRQHNPTVEVEHAPASIGLLMEFGGRSPLMNRDLGEELTSAGDELLDVTGHDDSLAVWKYNDTVQKLSDFSNDKLKLKSVFLDLGTPDISETNLYDAIIFTLREMRPVTGRKAILLISSGNDTFSKSRYEDALQAAREADIPIYTLSLGQRLRRAAELHSHAGPLAQIDWAKAEKTLEEISKVSGGRTYVPQEPLDLSPTYDDLLEHLKVRYVITYSSSSSNSDLNTPRKVRVELIDPKTGGPLRIVDANGKIVHANVVVQDSYTPASASAR